MGDLTNAREALRRKREAGQTIDRRPRIGRLAPITVAKQRAADYDEVTTPTTHYINGRVYGPGHVRDTPGIVATIRETDSRRAAQHLDPRTDLPMPSGGPPRLLPIKSTGIGLGEVVSGWPAEWRYGQAVEVFALMDQQEQAARRFSSGDICGACMAAWPRRCASH